MDTQHADGDLFPDGRYPKELLAASEMAGGLRYVVLGEDELCFMFFGRPRLDDVLAAGAEITLREGLDPDEAPHGVDDLRFVDAVLITSCPKHVTPDQEKPSGCITCLATPEDWQVWWHLDAQQHPARFPVTVWGSF